MLMSQSASSSPTPRSTSRVMTTGLIGPDSLDRGNLALVELTKLKVGGRVGPWSRMSALGQKQTCAGENLFCFGPEADSCKCSKKRSAATRRPGGTVRPSGFAVLRLIVVSPKFSSQRGSLIIAALPVLPQGPSRLWPVPHENFKHGVRRERRGSGGLQFKLKEESDS